MGVIHGFLRVREREIPELRTKATLFRHVKTGSELLSLVNDDENKVFGITFRTPPSDSTGIAHILEHSVLCGSRKYPVKEPFVELLKGSLKTFLNAMTYPDKTCYPVASQNARDFYNLVDVYLDAVFYPRLTPFIFQQEGWHYETERPEDPLTLKLDSDCRTPSAGPRLPSPTPGRPRDTVGRAALRENPRSGAPCACIPRPV